MTDVPVDFTTLPPDRGTNYLTDEFTIRSWLFTIDHKRIALLFFALQLFMSPAALSLALLIIDGVLGLGFLLLALRYTSLWLGAAMLLQAGQFSLHAFYYVTTKPVDRLFAVVNNVVSWGILLAILAGVGASWLNSRKLARQPAR